MASSCLLKMSEENFEYICSSCAEDDLIKEALKYCVECQQYCCKDCLTSHRRIATLKGHSFLDNSSVKPQGQSRYLPVFPTQQCSHHIGKLMNMYCKNHDVVCCYLCAAEDHRLCKDMVSISEHIHRLYSKTETSKAISDLGTIMDDINHCQTNTDILLRQLRDSKAIAIKAVSDYRVEMQELLKKLEEASIREIEDGYKKLESQLLEEKKRYEDSICDLKNLKQLIVQASENMAQLFVSTKLAEKKCFSIVDDAMKKERLNKAELKFLPSEDLKSSIKNMASLGEASAISSRKYNSCKATKICDMNIRREDTLKEAKSKINGSCIVDDTVLFTDFWNYELKRFDISSSSLVDYCMVYKFPCGICRSGEKEVAVACFEAVHFVSIHDKLSLSRSIKMKHWCYGIACSNDKLYITDGSKSLYMYDMSGSLLKTVTRDDGGQLLFGCSYHTTFNDKIGRLYVCDEYKGLVCFNAQCDYIETITDPEVRPDGVCVDGYGNVIVANSGLQSIVQCSRDGQKCSTLVNKKRRQPLCVCIHHGRRKMFVGYSLSTVEVYNLTWKHD